MTDTAAGHGPYTTARDDAARPIVLGPGPDGVALARRCGSMKQAELGAECANFGYRSGRIAGAASRQPEVDALRAALVEIYKACRDKPRDNLTYREALVAETALAAVRATDPGRAKSSELDAK